MGAMAGWRYNGGLTVLLFLFDFDILN